MLTKKKGTAYKSYPLFYLLFILKITYKSSIGLSIPGFAPWLHPYLNR